jgi:hypothetical protein
MAKFIDDIVDGGKLANTDKIWLHHYEDTYSRHLERYRSQPDFAMLEIGYGSGCGVQFWTTIFPQCHLYCFDKDIGGIGNDRYTVIQADQSDLESLETGIKSISRPISLIVDDGSHLPAHQLLSLSYLFDCLLDHGGTYVIEDVETSYWRAGSIYGYTFNYGLHDPWSTMEVLKFASDYINRSYLAPEDKSLIEYHLMAVGLDPTTVQSFDGIEFSRNCVVITKSLAERPVDIPYAHEQATRRF